MTETKLDVKTADGVADCYAFRPDNSKGPLPAILFFVDAFGVREGIKPMARRFAEAGFFVLMPNVFYRSGNFKPFDVKSAFSDPAERERLMKMIHSLDHESVKRDVSAYLDAIAAQPGVDGSKVGTTGYCMGGRLGFSVAPEFPERIAAVASFHGGGLATEQPTSPHLRAKEIKAQLYFGVADNDRSATPEEQARLVKALAEAHLNFQVELYVGKQHGWTVPDTPVFDKDGAEQHYKRAITLYREALPAARA